MLPKRRQKKKKIYQKTGNKRGRRTEKKGVVKEEAF